MLELILSGPLGAVITNTVGAYLANRSSKMDDTQADLRKAAKSAIRYAFEQWITAILKALEMQGFADDELQRFFAEYQPALEKFLYDSEVVDELLQPFSATDTKYQLNTTKLEQRWQALQLPALPDGFDLAGVNRAYVQRLKKAGIVTRQLRDLFGIQLAQERTGYLEDIRGVWPDFDLDNYAKRVETRYQVLDLSALTQPERDDFQKISLSAVFIPQSVRKQRPPRELPKEMWERLRLQGEVKEEEVTAKLRWEELRELQKSWERAEPEPVLDVLAQSENRCLVLLGDPGAGKSTLARYLLLSVLAPPADAQGSVPTWLATFQKRLPLLVELREYLVAVDGRHCECLLEYFHYLGKQGYALNYLILKEQLQIRPSLVIFDGLDEIFNPARREQVTQEIIGFAGEYPQARVLVTSRIIGYQGQALRAAQFQEYTLLDLDLDQIKTFARGWFNLVFQQQPEEAAFRYQRIETALQQSPAIRLLAGNPLLLTMIAIIAKHQELPRERVKLYEHAVKVLCHHWDVTRRNIAPDNPLNSFREDDKLELLRRLAWRMQAAPEGLKGNVIVKEDLQAEIEGYLQERWQKPLDKAKEIARAMIDQFRERNFILCHYGSQVYGFVHRTFLEYFCAAELVYRFEKLQTLSIAQLKEEVFLGHYRDETWHEVLRLICSMVVPKFAGELIGAIVPARQEAYEKTEDLILAVQCLAEVSKLNQIAEVARQVLESVCGWFEYVHREKSKILVFGFIKEENSLISRFIKEENFVEKAIPMIESIGKNWPDRKAFLPWLSEPNKQNSIFFAKFAEEAFSRMVVALWSDYEDTKQSLIALSEATPNMAFQALARSFGKQREIQILLQQQASGGEGGDIRRAALQALADHCTTLPKTLTLLRERATIDQDKTVRGAALSALAEYYSTLPETLTLLRERAITDQDQGVRRIALEALAKHYSTLPETLTLLRERAITDQEGEVRGATLSALVDHCTTLSGTLTLLRERAITDQDQGVRCIALEALAKHYSTLPETLTLLRERAITDQDQGVRRIALEALAKHYSTLPETLTLLRERAITDQDQGVRRTALEALAEHYSTLPETLTLLKQVITDSNEATDRKNAVAAWAKNYHDDIWQKLLSREKLWVECLDPKEDIIDEERVSRSSKKLNLPPATIRQHYEDIAQEIPLRLSWKE